MLIPFYIKLLQSAFSLERLVNAHLIVHYAVMSDRNIFLISQLIIWVPGASESSIVEYILQWCVGMLREEILIPPFSRVTHSHNFRDYGIRMKSCILPIISLQLITLTTLLFASIWFSDLVTNPFFAKKILAILKLLILLIHKCSKKFNIGEYNFFNTR